MRDEANRTVSVGYFLLWLFLIRMPGGIFEQNNVTHCVVMWA